MTTAILDMLQQKFGSSNFNRYQIIRQPKYDTVRYPVAGTTQLTFFTVPVGGTDPVGGNAKTAEQTNLLKSGSFGQEFYVITRIGTYVNLVPKNRQTAAGISGDASAVWHGFNSAAVNYVDRLADLYNTGVLNITLGQKLYFTIERPFINAPPPGGVDIQVFGKKSLAADPVRTGDWIYADPSVTDAYNVSPVQLIEPELAIAPTIDFPDGTSPAFTNTFLTSAAAAASPTVEVMLILDGYVIRPQQ